MSDPNGAQDADFLDSWIENALTIANGLRSFHFAPPLEWNDECYEAAKIQANICQEQNKLIGGNVKSAIGQHGQNLLLAKEPVDQWVQLEDVIDEWYNLSEKYCFTKPGPMPGCENLTQLLWVGTDRFGVAASDDGRYVVANFFPAGNVKGKYFQNVKLPEYDIDESVEELGMVFGSLPPNNLVVRDILDGGWGEMEGVKVGDRFVTVNGKPVPEMTAEEFQAAYEKRPLRLQLFIGVDHTPEDGDEVGPQLAKVADSARRGAVGRGEIELIVDKDVEKIGMVISIPPKPFEVRKVTPGGWADEKGIEPGDTFTRINDTPAHAMNNAVFTNLVQNVRPLTFVLPTSEEKAAAIKIQKMAKGKQARETAGAMKRTAEGVSNASDWRLARNREAMLERDADAKKTKNALQIPRQDMIARLFIALDRDQDKQLDEQELQLLAKGLEFPGEATHWTKEYADLCGEFGWEQSQGLSFDNFQELVDDSNANPYYCGYDRVCKILNQVDQTYAATKIQSIHRGRQARKRAKARAVTPRSQEAAASKTQDLQSGKQGQQTAASADVNNKDEKTRDKVVEGRRNSRLRRKSQEDEADAADSGWFGGLFGGDAAPQAPVAGAEGPSAEAQAEAARKIQALERGKQGRKEAAAKATQQNQNKVDTKAKLKRVQTSDNLYYDMAPSATMLTERATGLIQRKVSVTPRTAKIGGGWQEKARLAAREKLFTKAEQEQRNQASVKLQALQRSQVARTDTEVRTEVFSQFDRDKDGRLNEKEMLAIARCMGFDQDEQAWAQEFQALCADNKWDPKVGISVSSFVWLTKNPDDQYWFDAPRLSRDGWEAACNVQDQAPDASPPPPVMEVPLEAEIKGLDWAKLEGNAGLKARLMERLREALAQKNNVAPGDVLLMISPSVAS